MAERYNTPEQGTLDWHIPLNENFNKLDKHVEIRDVDGNRGNYDPKSGAKYLATDTGAVYLGDGSQWNYLGEIVPEQSGDTGSGRLVQPGNVQNAIDTVASNGGGTVRLDPKQRYEQPASPWTVKKDVTLDFNGATLYGDGSLNNTNFIHLHAGGQLWNPRINLFDDGNGYDANNLYSGEVFRLDTSFDSGFYFAQGTTIQNGLISAVGGGGTACKLTVEDDQTPNAITHIDLNYDINVPDVLTHEKSVDTALHLDTSNDPIKYGYINGVRITGNWRYPITGILQTGPADRSNKRTQQVRNEFRVQLQAGTDARAAWEIKDPCYSEKNIYHGWVWDFRNYDDTGGLFWRIDSTFDGGPDEPYRACQANAMRVFDARTDYVRNQSPNDHYLFRRHTWSKLTV